jgi:tetraacyldisaccharide 4'-kinase
VIREGAGARLTAGWERGFARGPDLALAVLERTYRSILRLRSRLYESGTLRSHSLGCPVVSVGNLTVGGTGKTPAVELAVQTLMDLGLRPAVVSRGYRRRSSGVLVVADTASIRLEPEEAGDEPFLLARRLPHVPVVVGTNRHAAARLAVGRLGATAIVLDDGFQHRTLAKDLEIVMVRARRPWGNGHLLPRGPLREPPTALRRADLVVATGAATTDDDLGDIRRAVAEHAPGVPVLAARYTAVECWEARGIQARPLDHLAGKRLAAFAGIAAPTAFAQTLDELGVDVSDWIPFADHHWYSGEDLARLDARAATTGAEGLVTTEKDWVRLRMLPMPGRPLYVVSVRLDLLSGHDAWRRAFEDACAAR